MYAFLPFYIHHGRNTDAPLKSSLYIRITKYLQKGNNFVSHINFDILLYKVMLCRRYRHRKYNEDNTNHENCIACFFTVTSNNTKFVVSAVEKIDNRNLFHAVRLETDD